MEMNNKDTKVTIYGVENSRTVLKTDSIVDSVIDKIIDRARVGKDKYKTDMDRSDLTLDEWATHVIEECLDAAIYLTKIKEELKRFKK